MQLRGRRRGRGRRRTAAIERRAPSYKLYKVDRVDTSKPRACEMAREIFPSNYCLCTLTCYGMLSASLSAIQANKAGVRRTRPRQTESNVGLAIYFTNHCIRPLYLRRLWSTIINELKTQSKNSQG